MKPNRKKTKRLKELSTRRRKVLQDWILMKEILLSLEHEINLGINYDYKTSRQKVRSGLLLLANLGKDIKRNLLKIDKGEEEE